MKIPKLVIIYIVEFFRFLLYCCVAVVSDDFLESFKANKHNREFIFYW